MNLIFDGEEERVESRMTHGLLTSENDETSKRRSGTFQSRNSLVFLLFSLRSLRETEGWQSLPRLCFEFKYWGIPLWGLQSYNIQHASPNNLCYPAKQLRKLIRPQLDFETQLDVLSVKIRTNLQVKNEEWYLTDVTHLVSCWVSCAVNVILTGRLKCHIAASGCCWSWGSVGLVGSRHKQFSAVAIFKTS